MSEAPCRENHRMHHEQRRDEGEGILSGFAMSTRRFASGPVRRAPTGENGIGSRCTCALAEVGSRNVIPPDGLAAEKEISCTILIARSCMTVRGPFWVVCGRPGDHGRGPCVAAFASETGMSRMSQCRKSNSIPTLNPSLRRGVQEEPAWAYSVDTLSSPLSKHPYRYW